MTSAINQITRGNKKRAADENLQGKKGKKTLERDNDGVSIGYIL